MPDTGLGGKNKEENKAASTKLVLTVYLILF